jgi:predicted ATPase
VLEIIQAHLPEEPNSFIGRERELDELRRLLYSTRALTLCGPGGIGKTRLALRLLAVVAAEFPDGAWFIELADLQQPDLVISRIAAVLGVSEEPGRALPETLADVLRRRRLVLALDNCEHLVDACAEVARQLLASSPGLRLVVTSREPLRVAGETVWRVPPLSAVSVTTSAGAGAGDHDEAIRLFADRAAASLPGFALGRDNIVAVAAICRGLDGLPLAIELAAAWVRVLSVDQICARLGNRFALLVTGDRSASPRQRTLRATIEWSYALLTEAEQMLFRRLSVFAGWSLEMAEQVCAGDDVPAGDVLSLTAAWWTSPWWCSSRRSWVRPATGCWTPSGNMRRCAGLTPGSQPGSSSRCATTWCVSRSTAWRSGWLPARSPGRNGSTAPAGTTSTRATFPRS